MKKVVLLLALLSTGFIIESAFEKHQVNNSEEIQLSNPTEDSSIETVR